MRIDCAPSGLLSSALLPRKVARSCQKGTLTLGRIFCSLVVQQMRPAGFRVQERRGREGCARVSGMFGAGMPGSVAAPSLSTAWRAVSLPHTRFIACPWVNQNGSRRGLWPELPPHRPVPGLGRLPLGQHRRNPAPGPAGSGLLSRATGAPFLRSPRGLRGSAAAGGDAAGFGCAPPARGSGAASYRITESGAGAPVRD